MVDRSERVEACEASLAAERAAADAALAAGRSALEAEKEKSRAAVQELELAKAMIASKEKDLELAIKAKLDVQSALEASHMALSASQKKAENEFDAGFFQGYADLKRRVALLHPEWDLSTFSGVESDFWDVDGGDVQGEIPAGGAEAVEGEEVGESGAAAEKEAEDTEMVVIDDP